MKNTPVVLVAAAMLAGPPAAAQHRTLTLDEALKLAHRQYAGLAALRHRVDEMERRRAGVTSNRLPRLQTELTYNRSSAAQRIVIPPGGLGDAPALGGPFPPEELNLRQGGTGLLYVVTTVTQPVTQLLRIREGTAAARADERAARAELARAEGDVAIGVLRGFSGLLLARRNLEAARERLAIAQERMRHAAAATAAGEALDVAEAEARLRWLEARQALLAAEDEIDDRNAELVYLLGLPPGTRLEPIAPPAPESRSLASLEAYVEHALREHPDVLEAAATADRAAHAVAAARTGYIPELGLVGTHVYQSSVPFLPRNSVGAGVRLSWTVWDFGQRAHAVDERRAQRAQAEWELTRMRDRVRADVAQAYRRVSRARAMMELAAEALHVRAEAARLRANLSAAGHSLAADSREAAAEYGDAEAALLEAQLGYRIARAELERAAGGVVPQRS